MAQRKEALSLSQAVTLAADIGYPVKCETLHAGNPVDMVCWDQGELEEFLGGMVHFRDGMDTATLTSH